MVEPAHHDEEAIGKAYDARLMRRLLRYLWPYKLPVLGAFLMLLAGATLEVAGPWIVQIAIDDAIPDSDLQLLALLVATYLGANLLGFLLDYLDTLLTTWLGQSVMHDLRTEIFAKLQRADLRYYDRNPVGRLMTRITNDVETLNELFSSGVVTVFGDLFTLLFIVAVMFRMDWRLALITLAVLPFVVLVAFVFRARIREAYREIRTRLAHINAYLQERITGMRVVQLFNREQADGRRHEEINDHYLEAHLRSITYYALFFPVIEVLTSVALALIIWYGGGGILGGTVTVGVVAAFLQYARRFFRPIQDLSEKYNLLQAALASSERVFRLLDREEQVKDPVSPIALPEHTRGEIEFQDVWFAYAESADGVPDWVIKGLSFRAAAGEKVAIVGHTGAGKTTIINLLMRFYDVQQGEIRLDGVPIHRARMRDLRASIGLVLQDVFLFSEDIRYNVRLGASISEERLVAAARRVSADRLVRKLPLGYYQPLGERGTSLSVGERQLVSFARALAFDPPILVLDEATSSVDSEIEAQIEAATNELLEGRTSLVIAHRLSTVRGADRILVLHHGELREEGSHVELLARGGLYARLHELQFARVPAA